MFDTIAIAIPVAFAQKKPFGAKGKAQSMFSGVYFPLLDCWGGKIDWTKSHFSSLSWLRIMTYRFNSKIGILTREKGIDHANLQKSGELSPSGKSPDTLSVEATMRRLEAWLKS
jgi:hypothetical protein